MERVRLNSQEKSMLTRMKATTGIDNWNTFARWAFCYSLSMDEQVSLAENAQDANAGIEMTWMVFAGKNFKIYQDLLVQECLALDLKPNKSNLNKVMRAHLSNGIKKMYSQVSCIDDFLKLTT